VISVGIDAPDFYKLSDRGPYIIINAPEEYSLSIYPLNSSWFKQELVTFTEARNPHLHRLIRMLFKTKHFEWKK
jgi:hypothetical protein